MACSAGFLFASHRNINYSKLAYTVIGTGLVISSSCVINNILDRNIDAKMARTRKRAIASGDISVVQASLYATLLGAIGFAILIDQPGWLTAMIGGLGLIFYTVVYGYAKRASPVGTLVGSISGAAPLVAGYVAASQHIDYTVLILALAMAAWQMPHFYAIAIFRQKDYQAARIPTLPIVKGFEATTQSILRYQVVFVASLLLLSWVADTSLTFAAVMALISSWWLLSSWRRLPDATVTSWARRTFGQSLIVLSIWSASLMLNAWLP